VRSLASEGFEIGRISFRRVAFSSRILHPHHFSSRFRHFVMLLYFVLFCRVITVLSRRRRPVSCFDSLFLSTTIPQEITGAIRCDCRCGYVGVEEAVRGERPNQRIYNGAREGNSLGKLFVPTKTIPRLIDLTSRLRGFITIFHVDITGSQMIH